MPNRESAELRWVAEDEVATLPLHPGFAASWAELRAVAATIPLPTKPSLEPARGRLRVVGRGDRPHHDDAARARVEHLGQPLLVDAADREPGFGCVAVARRLATSGSPGAARPGFVGVGQHGPTQK